MFKRLEGDTAILKVGGVYKTADLYERDGKLFAAALGGYVRLYDSGATSKDGLNVDTIASDAPLYRDRFGRLCTAPGEGREALSSHVAMALMISKD